MSGHQSDICSPFFIFSLYPYASLLFRWIENAECIYSFISLFSYTHCLNFLYMVHNFLLSHTQYFGAIGNRIIYLQTSFSELHSSNHNSQVDDERLNTNTSIHQIYQLLKPHRNSMAVPLLAFLLFRLLLANHKHVLLPLYY